MTPASYAASNASAICVGRGDQEQAISWLHEAAEERDGLLSFRNVWFAFEVPLCSRILGVSEVTMSLSPGTRLGHYDVSVRELELLGDPVRVLEQVDTEANGAVNFALSPDGSLVYFGGGTPILDTVERVDREGRITTVVTDGDSPRLSPDRTQLAFRRGSGMQFWVRTLDSGSELRLDAAPGWGQSWTRRSEPLVYSSVEFGKRGLRHVNGSDRRA